MTARSVVLSVLLGAHPACATASELVRLTADFGLKESAVRVALTRMVSAGDLVRDRDGYRLSDRLLARQRRQDDALNPRLREWNGDWTMLVITSVGTDARTRSGLRTALQQNRFAELREGVWLRPDNLDMVSPADVLTHVRVMRARDDDPVGLAAQLWDLSEWAATGRELLDEIDSAPDIPGRFVAAAGIVRHLLTDPVLPAELLPDDWPGAALREVYTTFAAELSSRREPEQLMEAT
ncbi:PaaX family transcriptional regulator C-terminal domain-containing protein [Mycolicibacterium elephantis]|uniref:PaaX domain-containing protein, C-domain n=1 Tax=Mycolicibacterium elephantis DSM 44368 TaxID=1335622 RepID=A0A439DRX9_9MYCO|nr:PaaX domain-containing protein, C- domain [Mycolicibacterium elephantis DSM 44368]